MNDQIKPLIGNLCSFAKKRLNFSEPPRLFLRQDSENSKNALGKTAHYNPHDKSITIFITSRHPKDILRSFAHELVHHAQNLRGDLAPEKCGDTKLGYAQSNKHLRNMEKEAYLSGNMCFRDWEDSLKSKEKKLFKIAETKYLKENKKMSVKVSRKFVKEVIGKLLKNKLNEQLTDSEGKPLKQAAMVDLKDLPDAMEDAIEVGGSASDLDAVDEIPGLSDEQREILKKGFAELDKILSAQGEEASKSINAAIEALKAPQVTVDPGSLAGDEDSETIRIPEASYSRDDDKKDKDSKPCASCGEPKCDCEKEEGSKDKKDKDLDEGEKIKTPEQENNLYEQRFSRRNNHIFEKLVKEWTK